MRSLQVFSKCGVAVTLSLALGGCVGSKMYRPVSVEEKPGYTLAFIEFDDQGEMWAPDQLSRALASIEKANRFERGAVVVTYMHGWMHNASPKNERSEKGNVHGFKRFLETIRQGMDRVASERERPLVGVYLAWRGKSGTIPGLNFLTFYSRAGAARRVAGVSSTEVIYRLLTAAKSDPRSRTLLMGHSFGGQIVERAVTQSLVGELLDRDQLPEYGLPADLIVLVNPAAKSIQAKQFLDMLDRSRIKLYRTDREGNRYEVPLMVSITSSADLATRWAFPLGTAVSSLSKRFHRYPEESCLPFERQRSFYLRTPGHNRGLISHRVTAEPLPEAQRPTAAELVGERIVRSEFDPVSGRRVISFDGLENSFTIESIQGALNDTPYWIMRVPRALIPGHSGFFTTDTLRLISAILVITGALEPESRTEIVRDDGVRPQTLAALPDGRVLVSDASRRIFRVEVDSPSPYSFGCVPQVADPASSIGMVMRGEEALSVRSRPTARTSIRGGDEYRTEFLRVSFAGGETTVEDPVRIQSKTRFSSVAFDFDGNRFFLATGEGGEIYVADLLQVTRRGGRKEIKPTPQPWVRLEGAESITKLFYEQASGVLLAVEGRKGILYAVRETAAGLEVERVAGSLGWPVGLTADETRGWIYVGDAREQRIWRLQCSPDRCSEPTVFAQGDPLISPSLLDIAPDGTLWVGDPEARRIVALSTEGKILQTIARLPVE